jgi:hypothetical protein
VAFSDGTLAMLQFASASLLAVFPVQSDAMVV